MKPNVLIKTSIYALISGLLISGLAQANSDLGTFSQDDGTYSTSWVKSVQECEDLCKADEDTCRGTVVYQADITKNRMECRLNNGFGQDPVFPRTPPKEIDFGKALSDLNAYRASKGLTALKYNEKLNQASHVHVADLAQAGIISHTGTDGSGHGDRIQRQGYYFSIAAENVATGQTSWEDAFEGWQNSPGHNENLLREDVTEFGLAMVYEPTTKYSTYWAMLVANPIDINAPIANQ